MVKLCVNGWNVTVLEWMLRKNDIPYKLEFRPPDIGLLCPYLIVDGVPLDLERAIKWIEGRADENKEV